MMAKSDPSVKTITLSEVKQLEDAGWTVFRGGDAAKANSDHFLVMVRKRESAKSERDVMVFCPTFLRGPLYITDGSIAY
jgi:hypothetical protein